VKVTVIVALADKESEQGVRQVCPVEVFASAPGGSDSNCTVSIAGAGFSASRFIQSGVEHAARANPPITIAITRYILL